MSHPAAFAPLANRAFLALWIANLLSNTGGWMASTGAAWEMTSLTSEPIFVALLAASGTLPMFLFCFFAGILADRFVRQLRSEAYGQTAQNRGGEDSSDQHDSSRFDRGFTIDYSNNPTPRAK